MSNISENLFQAMDILMSSKMHDMKYDKTVLCKIESSPNKEKGEYVVSDGSSKFIAYSENTSYQDGTSVYVTIPGGDYNQRKLIAGRYVEDNGEHFTYRAPFEDYLDITENLIEDDVPVSTLLANGTVKEVILWSRDFEKERMESGEEDYVGIGKGYQVLGLSAKFRSWLGALNPVSGSYGLRVDLVSRETATSKTDATEKYYSFYLTTDDMFGNVYNFETYYSQEKIFDISMVDEVARLQLVFYQKQDFYDKNGDPIPITKGDVGLPDNLFVKEPYLSFGYNLNSFTEDTVMLYSFDSLTYTPQASPEQNTKRLMARWIHFDEEGQIVAIDKASEIPLEAKLHWYKFNLTEGVTDELAGNFWEEITEPNLLNQLYFKFLPDIAKQNEKYKIIVEYPSREIINQDIDDGLAVMESERDTYATEEEYQAAVETFILEQQSRIMYLYSDVFTFENEVACVNDATVDLVQALQIVCDPKEEGGLQGNYCIYDMTNELLNPTEGKKVRKLEATYKSLVTGEESLDKAASITWKIPITNTMIYMPEEGVEYFTIFEEGSEQVPDEIMNDGNFLYITRKGTEDYDVDPEVTELQIEVLQHFRIKSYYTQNATNNTIYCSIFKNNRTYEASTTLAFGPMGTNGTDVTLIPTLADNASAVMPGQSINVEAKLYDYENKEIEFDNIEWSWWSTDGKISIKNKKSNPCTITANSQPPIYHNILKVKVRHNDIDLEAYLPIPIKSSENVKFAEVPSRVVYDANGSNAAYYKNPLRVIKVEDNTEFIGTWDMVLEDDVSGNVKYYPYVQNAEDGTSKMIPPSMFFNDLDRGVTLVFNSGKEYWYQPILIIQNRWPSAMLNSWDGSLTIDEENGTILSTMVGAGKKESDNTYTGVLMGDVETGSGDKTVKKTGVYGYNHGMQSFGFMDDGTAFIGKMGKGRIVFDGNEGRIASMSRSQNEKAGMLIDLDDGYIDILGVEQNGVTGTNGYFSNPVYKESGAHVRIDVKDPYLTITTAAADGHLNSSNVLVPSEIMHVGVGKYFLQSADYSTSAKKGTHIDIAKGSYISYDPSEEGNGDYIKLSSEGNPFLQIYHASNNISLMYVGKRNFYLQSPDFKSDTGASKGIKLDIINSTFQAYDKNGNGDYVKISGNGNPFMQVYHAGKDVNMFYVGDRNFYLQSPDYPDGNKGMKIDIINSMITAYDPSEGATGDYIRISGQGSPFLHVYHSTSGESLMYVGNRRFFLQSPDFKDTKGMNIDIINSTIKAFDKNGSGDYISISGQGTPFLKIYQASSAQTLMHAGDSQFYMQSPDFKDKKGMKVDIIRSTITAYDSGGSGDYIEIKGSGSPFLRVYDKNDGSDTGTNIIYCGEGNFYMQSSNYSAENGGLYINFKNGTMKGGNGTTSWEIKKNGEATFNSITAKTGGQIGPFKVDAEALYTSSKSVSGEGVYLGTAGLGVANGMFVVNSAGQLTCKHITATEGGKIGPFNISSSGLSTATATASASTYNLRARAGARAAGTVDLTSSGISVNGDAFTADTSGNVSLKGVITGTLWNVTEEGVATFENLVANKEGTIGGWTITDKGLSGTNMYLDAKSGHIKAGANATAFIDMDASSIWIRGNIYCGYQDNTAGLTCWGKFKTTKEASLGGNTDISGTLKVTGNAYFDKTLYIIRNGEYMDVISYINKAIDDSEKSLLDKIGDLLNPLD